MSRFTFIVAAAAIVACHGPVPGDASISYKGRFELSRTDADVPAAVQRQVMVALAPARAREPARVFGCWYAVAEAKVNWRCEGSLTPDELRGARLRIPAAAEVDARTSQR